MFKQCCMQNLLAAFKSMRALMNRKAGSIKQKYTRVQSEWYKRMQGIAYCGNNCSLDTMPLIFLCCA